MRKPWWWCIDWARLPAHCGRFELTAVDIHASCVWYYFISFWPVLSQRRTNVRRTLANAKNVHENIFVFGNSRFPGEFLEIFVYYNFGFSLFSTVAVPVEWRQSDALRVSYWRMFAFARLTQIYLNTFDASRLYISYGPRRMLHTFLFFISSFAFRNSRIHATTVASNQKATNTNVYCVLFIWQKMKEMREKRDTSNGWCGIAWWWMVRTQKTLFTWSISFEFDSKLAFWI